MKVVYLLGILALTGAALYFTLSETESNAVFQQYAQWKKTNNVHFDQTEDAYRLAVFTQNYKYVQEFNSKAVGENAHRLGLNTFAVYTNEEFVEKFIGQSVRQEYVSASMEVEQPATVSIPSSLNWVDKGAVAPVENQGSCGSCWAFSTKEALEGLNQIKNGKLVVLSPQQLVDCSTASFGCNGGYQTSTFTYTAKNGITTEAQYPYVSGNTGKATACTYNSSTSVYKNGGSAVVSPRNNQNAILNAVQNQPLSVLVAASGINFQLYSSGVLKSCGTQTDHAILLTGYNNGSDPYYIVKNSWGTSWGQKGYAWLAMTGDGAGTCSVQTSVVYPTA